MRKSYDSRDMAALFLHNPNPACVLSPVTSSEELVDLRLLEYNDAFSRILRLSEGGVQAGSLISESLAEDAASFIELSSKVLMTRRAQWMRLFVARRYRWLSCSFALSESGNIVATFSLDECDDLADRMKPSASLFSNIFESGGIKLIIRSSDGRILACNRAAREFYGWSQEVFTSLRIDQIDISPPDVVRRTMDSIDADGLAIFRSCHRIASGEEKAVEVHSYKGHYEGGAVHYAAVFDRFDSACTMLSLDEPAEISRGISLEERHFEPFIERYEGPLPYVRDLVRQIIPYGQLILYQKGEHFLEYGTMNPNVGFVLGGLFRLYTISEEGLDCSLKLLRAGDVLYVDPKERRRRSINLAVEAMNGCLVFVIAIRHFAPLVDRDIRWSKLFYYTTMEAEAQMLERQCSLLSDSASRRYERFSEEEEDALQFLQSYHVASYIGVTPETLSRIRRTRRKRGDSTGAAPPSRSIDNYQ